MKVMIKIISYERKDHFIVKNVNIDSHIMNITHEIVDIYKIDCKDFHKKKTKA